MTRGSPAPGRPSAHLGDAQLLDWWLHDTDAATTEAVDAHLMRCAACNQRLDAMLALGKGVRQALRDGAVAAVLNGAFVARLRSQGLRVHEVHLPHNASVQCRPAPGDHLLLARLAAPLRGVRRLDLEAESSCAPGRPQRLRDVPFDAAAGELLFAPDLAALRRRPSQAVVLRLLAVDGKRADRLIGRYALRHLPWLEPPAHNLPPPQRHAPAARTPPHRPPRRRTGPGGRPA